MTAQAAGPQAHRESSQPQVQPVVNLGSPSLDEFYADLLANRVDISEALQAMDDKTLNGLVQAIDVDSITDATAKMALPPGKEQNCNSPSNEMGNPARLPLMHQSSTSSFGSIGNNNSSSNNNGNVFSSQGSGGIAGQQKAFWTPLQKIHQMSEFWNRGAVSIFASSSTSSPETNAASNFGNASNGGNIKREESKKQLAFGQMSYWYQFVEEFFEYEPASPTSSANTAGDIGLFIYVSEAAIRSHERNSTVNAPKKPYFIPRSLIPRFFWTMSGGVETEKVHEAPMNRLEMSLCSVKESFVRVQRRGYPNGNNPNGEGTRTASQGSTTNQLLLLDSTNSTFRVTRDNGLLTDQTGTMRLWFSQSSKIVRWEWCVEQAYEWRLCPTLAYPGYHGKSLKLIAGFSSRTWGVLEVRD